MCIFSQPIEHVSTTRIFARAETEESPEQLLAYEMTLEADAELAMILPVPVPPCSPDDAVRFVDLGDYPSFFEDLEASFPAPVMRSLGELVAGSAPNLEVHRVGAFEASFVSSLADFVRLDPRFRLSDSLWEALPT